MKTMKKIALLLCFIMIVSTVIGNSQLTAAAQGEGTTFTFKIENYNGASENTVSYSFDCSEWMTVSTGEPIDISGNDQIFVKAEKKDDTVSVDFLGSMGFPGETDFGGVTGENGQFFQLESGVSYVMNVNFRTYSMTGGDSVTGGDSGDQPSVNNGGLRIDISNRDSASGTVTYTFLDAEDNVLGDSVGVQTSTENNIVFPEGTAKVNIRLTPGENCQVSYYGVYVQGQLSDETDVEAAAAPEGNTITIADSSQEYQIQTEFAGAGGISSDPVPADAISFRVEGNDVDKAKVEYSIDNGLSWTQITGEETLDASVESAQVKVTYDSAEVDVQGNISESGIVENGVIYTVTAKQQYWIQVDRHINTVVWAYDDTFDSTGKVEHGKVEIISAVKPGETGQWSGIEPELLPGENNNSQDERGGRVAIIPGSTVTVKIVPDYGYQFTAGMLNGTAITPGEEVSSFTFTMPYVNLHLSALFTESADQVDFSGATGVTGAGIEGGSNVISSGNLRLTVTDSAIDDSAKNALQSSDAGAGITVTSWLEVDLEQIVNKGNNTDVWTTDLEELPSAITITLNVGTGLDSSKEYVVVREHNGVYERIPAVYDAEAGTLTFQSDKFSNYAVGTVQTVQEIIENGWNGSNSSAADTVNNLVSNFTAAEIAAAVQASDGTVDTSLLNSLSELENDYASEQNITVSAPAVNPAVAGSVSGTVSVTGAAFNAAAGSSVQLVINDRAGNGITVGSGYSRAVQLDLNLLQTVSGAASAITGELDMPVTITMPVPAGIDASKLVILHDRNSDGISDETVPYALAGGNVTFTVTHFSNFAFAEIAGSTGDNTGDNTGGNTGDNTGGSTGGNTGDNTGGSTGGNTGDNTGGSTGGNTGGNTGGSTGDNTGSNTGGAGSSGSSSDSNDSSSGETAGEQLVRAAVEYTVVRGDTLARIARRNHMTLSALLALNPQITNPNLIRPGQKIIVGYTDRAVISQAAESANSAAEYYVVQRGDYLYRIARKNGLTLAQLSALNPEILRQRYIYRGQRIRVK